MCLVERELPGVKASLLPHPEPKANSEHDSDGRKRPPSPPLQARGARLRRCDLGEPHLLAGEGFLRGLVLGFLARAASSEIGSALLAETLAEVLARKQPLGLRKAVGTMIEPGFEPTVTHPFAGRPLDPVDELQGCRIDL